MVTVAARITRHKFNARPQTVDDIRFASQKEAHHYRNLVQRCGEGGDLLFFLRQVPFHLPGQVRYVCDFQVFTRDGTVEFHDVKGFKTPQYKAKKKMVESIYPISIMEV